LDPPGKALGVFPDPELGYRTLRLRVGETVVLYTDGVVEARGPDGSFFGEERLMHLLSSCGGLEAQTVAEKLRDIVLEYGEGAPRDDLAVLVLRVPR
jgi:serine phosphatase RsbU (regulator of sigma subunit)